MLGGVLLVEGGIVILCDVWLIGGVCDEMCNEFGSGLQFLQGVQGDVQGSDFVGNVYGVFVSDIVQFKLKDSILSDNLFGGVIFLDSLGGEVCGSMLECNGGDGLMVWYMVVLVIVDSELCDNGECGLSVEGQVKLIVKCVIVSGNIL